MLVVAHGNCMRALRKHIDGIVDDDIVDLEIPTGIPTATASTDDLPSKALPRYLRRAPDGGRPGRRAEVARQAG